MWSVRSVINFPQNGLYAGPVTEEGFTPLGLHGPDGSRFALSPRKNRISCIGAAGSAVSWSVGPRAKNDPDTHIPADLDDPSWIEDFGGGSYLITDTGHNRICILDVAARSVETYIDLKPFGAQNPSNCILDGTGRIWVNDPGLAMLWVFTRSGDLLRALGSETPPGESADAAPPERPLDAMNLGPVYDMRRGNGGMVYILEGGRYRLRAVDFQRNTVSTVAGCGARGYSGDGGDPRAAAFGGGGRLKPDGPWAFCVGEDNALYVADTHNGAVREINPERTRVTTIAGGGRASEAARCSPGDTDPLRLNLPAICWMDWGSGMLFITDRGGDLAVLGHDAPTMPF